MRIDLQSKAKIRRDAVSDIFPGIGAIVAAIKAPVILEVYPLRVRRMADDLVNALAPLGILLVGRQKLGAHAFIARLPVFAAVIRAIDAAGRDGDEQAFVIRWVRKNGVQAESAAARHPLRSVRMIEQPTLKRPR